MIRGVSMIFYLWYLNKNIQSMTERHDAEVIEVYDLKNGVAGQRSIDEFDMDKLPRMIEDPDGFEV